QQPPVDPVRLHIADDARITSDLLGALEDENVSQHRAGEEPERASPADKEIEVRVEGPPACASRGVLARGSRLRHRHSSASDGRAPQTAGARLEKSGLKRVRLRQRLGQILIIFAVLAAKLPD